MPKKKARSAPRRKAGTGTGARKPRAVSASAVAVQRFPKRPPGSSAIEREGRALPIEVDPRRIEDAMVRVRSELTKWAKKGRYTKVRFKFRGKQVLPDLPLAAVMAAEGLTFYWGGILRAMIVNLAGNAVFNVELVNDSEKKVVAGREALLTGDVEKALALFREAVDMQGDNANAFLNIGIALRLKGDRSAARAALEHARSLDPQGPFGGEAERILATLPGATVMVVPEP